MKRKVDEDGVGRIRVRQERRRGRRGERRKQPVLIQKSRQRRKIPRQACLLWKSGEHTR